MRGRDGGAIRAGRCVPKSLAGVVVAVQVLRIARRSAATSPGP